MADVNLTQTDWDVRLFLYETIVSTGDVPPSAVIADHFDMTIAEATQVLRRLHDAHLIFLSPNTDELMMAFPLSAIETDYKVVVDGVILYANCAWDSLGIPAMIGKDATITVTHPTTREAITYAVVDGQLQGEGLLHIAKPFAQWYDDLIDT